MNTSGKCPKCGHAPAMRNMEVLDRGGKGAEYSFCLVGNAGDKDFFSNNQAYYKIDCCVCAKCGYIELYRGTPVGKWADLS